MRATAANLGGRISDGERRQKLSPRGLFPAAPSRHSAEVEENCEIWSRSGFHGVCSSTIHQESDDVGCIPITMQVRSR